MNIMIGLCVFFLFAAKAQAYSTHDFWIPQAKTLEQGEIKFDTEQRFTVDKSAGTFSSSLWGVSGGILHWGRFKFEAGLDWREPNTTTTASALSAHARVVFNNVQEDGWAVGVGIDQLGFHPGRNDYNVNHLVFQNLLGDDWEMAFGGYAGNATFLRSDDKGMFFGFWRFIQNGHGQFGLEWMSGNSELGFIVPGIKVEIRDGVVGELAYGFANRRNIVKDWALVRIAILF
jgi:hypothetical protein